MCLAVVICASLFVKVCLTGVCLAGNVCRSLFSKDCLYEFVWWKFIF